jgi:YidC/Oxa1 family membrane protein insertase
VFTTIIIRPIFNLLVAIYALLPGHNFGLAIIIFTVVVRLLLWPLLKKQLHQAKLMRQLQPEIKKIKAATKGNRQKEALMMQELYKERGINPLGSIGIILLQLPILIGLYSGLRRLVNDPHQLTTFSYPFLQHLSWMKELAHNIHLFDHTLFGVVDLTRAATSAHGGIYWPAMVIVLGSAIVQYYQSKQLMPTDKDSKGLRAIMREAGSGKQADQSELNAAVGRSTRYLLPVMIFLFTVNLPSALSLYWLVGGLVAFIQQSIALREDTTEMEAIADTKEKKDVDKITEAEVVEDDSAATSTKVRPSKPQRKKTTKKRRRK